MRIGTATCVALLVAASWVSLATDGWAQTGGGYALTWSSLDCGSPTTTSGAGYALRGTVGQADGGNLSGGAYVLHGGYWNGGRTVTDAPPPDLTEGTGALVFRLQGNSPNPFTTSTAIAFNLGHEEQVELQVFDLAGRVVRHVLERRLGPGRHQVVWDGRDDSGVRTAHGIYMLRLRAGAFQARRKLALVP